MKKIIAAVLGGVVAFVWGMISWMALPFHNQTLGGFQSEPVVAAALKAAAPKSGVYVLPWCEAHDKGLSKEEKKVAFERTQKEMREGPFAFLVVHPNGVNPSMGGSMVLGFLKEVMAALIIVFLLGGCAKNFSYWQKVFFITMLPVIGAILTAGPNLIWWHFPVGFVALNLLDLVIAWFLAGLVMAKIAK